MTNNLKIVSCCISLIVLIVALPGCTTGKIKFRKAEVLKKEGKFIEAVDHYMEAVKAKPKEARYRLKLMEALIEASNYYYRRAMDNKKEKQLQLALLELNKALEYNPSNNLAKVEKKALLKLLSGENPKPEKTWIEKIKERTALKKRVPALADEEKISLKFGKKVDLKKALEILGETAGINILFDSGVKNGKLSMVLEEITLSMALDRICLIKGLFYKVLDEKTIIIIPDSPAKRKIFEEQIIKNYYLSNIKAEDCVKLITRVTRIKNVIADSRHNTVTVREVPEKVALVERLIKFYDKRKAEVLIKVDIMEVNKDRLTEYGSEFSQYQVGQSLVGADQGGVRGNRFHFLNASDFNFTIPTIVYKLLESDSDSRVIARPQVRGEDGEKININLGDKVPFPRTSFVPFAAGGQEQQPITSYDLTDVGIEITITPYVHHDGEITMELDFKLTFITSPGTSTLPPTIGNRSVKTRLRLKDGETGIMAGLLRDENRKSRKGIPGLNRVPILGDLLSSNRKQVSQSDIILRVTPYIIRMPDIEETDLAPIESGTEDQILLKK